MRQVDSPGERATALRVCTFCVMDSTDDGAIRFDRNGQCNCCRAALARLPHEWLRGPEGERKLEQLAERIRRDGRGRPYDALIGLSGGIDSAYLAHMLRTRFDLRLLALHVDGGWNSATAVANIESIVRKLDIDLHTQVIEWEEMRELQLAFLRASVLNQDIPQDHAFFVTLNRMARKFGLRYFLSGVNFSSESIVAPDSGLPWADGKHLRAIHRRFGRIPLTTFPTMDFAVYLWYTRLMKTPAVERPLDLIDYDKVRAKAELEHHYDWQDYGGKHHESRFTKFYEEVYLPEKTGFDKRRIHLSSLIVSGQYTREAALRELERPIVDQDSRIRQTRYIAKKLGIPVEELTAVMRSPLVPHTAYPHGRWLRQLLTGARVLKRRASSLWSTPQ